MDKRAGWAAVDHELVDIGRLRATAELIKHGGSLVRTGADTARLARCREVECPAPAVARPHRPSCQVARIVRRWGAPARRDGLLTDCA
jgi:hypothetical protein